MPAMEECKADGESCAVRNAIVGMVIGGRAARACDVCGKERARWFCGADSAYLCERCDGSVHSANAVASRHERVRLGSNGAPVKTPQKPTPSVSPAKRDAGAVGFFPAANLNPRKKPRSIRRHKPSSVHVSMHCISAKHTSNHMHNSLIYPPNHSIMINNPRNDVDFIADTSIEFSKFVVKAEPVSPIDVGEQVKVPDHTDDDPLFESLFDFRDLQDDDLFLHQVPIYNPPHTQDATPPIDSKQSCAGYEGSKPMVILPPYEERKECGSPKSPCAAAPTHLSEPASQVDLGSATRDGEANEGLFGEAKEGPSDEATEGPLVAKCEEPERLLDSDTGLCEFDQLDFDSMLHGEDEDGDEDGSPANSMCDLDLDVSADDYMDGSDCHITRDDGGSYAEDHSCAGNGMDVDAIDNNHDAAARAGYDDTYDFDTMGSESPRTWLCKVKVESPSEFDALVHVDNGDVDVLLREKLACKAETQSGFKLGLKLNFEDVLHAWSDRGTFWMDGHPPQQLDSCLDFLGGWLVPDLMSSTTTTEGDGQQLVPMLNESRRGDGSAREASVLRYREKRRTRLFCKKIRYEVRKLNAEKRPRMKGRFVKRISIAV